MGELIFLYELCYVGMVAMDYLDGSVIQLALREILIHLLSHQTPKHGQSY